MKDYRIKKKRPVRRMKMKRKTEKIRLSKERVQSDN